MSDESVIDVRKRKLITRIQGDPILAGEVQPFLDDGEWSYDGDEIVSAIIRKVGANWGHGGVDRILEISRSHISIGRTDFPERKRIAL
jgi:hypothetical protein